MASPELSCQELVELVTDYLEGALPAGEQARFEAHIQDCTNCSTHLQQMQQTILLMGRLTENEIPPAVREELLNIFRDWKQSL